MAIEKSEEERSDMGAIDIGIGHDDDAVVTKSMNVILLFPNARAQGRDENSDLFIGQHLIEPSLFHIEDLPFDGKDGLKGTVSALFGRTPCRIPFDDEDLTQLRISLLTISQFSREGVSF
jgi:hypothetical protein